MFPNVVSLNNAHVQKGIYEAVQNLVVDNFIKEGCFRKEEFEIRSKLNDLHYSAADWSIWLTFTFCGCADKFS